jgi:ribonuclease BN (tRNA processing enzyme)
MHARCLARRVGRLPGALCSQIPSPGAIMRMKGRAPRCPRTGLSLAWQCTQWSVRAIGALVMRRDDPNGRDMRLRMRDSCASQARRRRGGIMYQCRHALLAGAAFTAAHSLAAQVTSRASALPAPRSAIIVLGDGTPVISADRSGTSIGIVVRGTIYIFDAGPGVIRRVFEARQRIREAPITRFGPVFVTHLHSDHTLGLAELLYYARQPHEPFAVFGPPGLKNMMTHILAAFAEDREIRVNGLEHADSMRWVVHPSESTGGVVYRDSNVAVQAFEVPHGSWPHALGYRIETPDRVIVLSGDTRPSEAVVQACNGCDVLLHEVSADAPDDRAWKTYNDQFHTTPAALGQIAQRAQPKLLIMYHQVFGDDSRATLIRQVAATFHGPIISARDLDVY